MNQLIPDHLFSLIKEKNETAATRIKSFINKYSHGTTTIGVGASIANYDHSLSYILEAYPPDHEGEEYGISLGIDLQEKDGIIEGDCYIAKETGPFILSPKTFIVTEDTDIELLLITLDECYHVFELILKNYLFDADDYRFQYKNRW
ncbi:hypothetical protein [Taibaiella koreensis]|uniref:hypothetical protein n=1 Tax=Taibaiella koreensis TaxID=1268548 RepID=UPI0013C2A3AB|nr:hypothetical protein [Taibaiella koreensis]